MNLIPRSSLFNIDRMFDDFWGPMRAGAESPNTAFVPRVDVKDNADHFEISAELPGVKKEDINVTLENGVLTLSAESRQESKEEKEGQVIRQERRYGLYQRAFNVGIGVQEKDIQASFNDGILTLRAPKSKNQDAQTKRIQIN